MGKCIASTAYTMKADIYTRTVTQDSTGAMVTNWSFEKTVDCIARSIIRAGIGDNSTSIAINDYLNTLNSMIKFRCSQVLSSDRRVVRIRNDDGVIFLENQDPSSAGGFQGSTIYEPRGSTPMVGFDGTVIGYETILMRQEIQKLSV